PAGMESMPRDKSSPLAHLPAEEKDGRAAMKDMGEKPSPPPTPAPLQEAVPLYKQNPPPEYPRLARRRGYQGRVLLEVLVNQEGKVQDLRLLQSSGFPVLDRAAMASVRKWGFEPGRKGDDAVDMWVKVPVRFQLR
ncbi:energy transducer TonB, partial [Thermodesulfobacteriota bacterium]